jgi:oleate hydratase
LSPQQCGSWALWETLSKKRKDVFGDPSVFTGHVDETKFVSYTVTQNDPLFFDLMKELTDNEPGRNGIISLPESPWMLTFILNHQPYYQNQPEGNVFYGIALPGRDRQQGQEADDRARGMGVGGCVLRREGCPGG